MHLGSGDISYIPAIVATAAAKLTWTAVYPWEQSGLGCPTGKQWAVLQRAGHTPAAVPETLTAARVVKEMGMEEI